MNRRKCIYLPVLTPIIVCGIYLLSTQYDFKMVAIFLVAMLYKSLVPQFPNTLEICNSLNIS